MKGLSRYTTSLLAVAGLMAIAPHATAASFLDLTSVTPGVPGTGSFEGTLGGVAVTGSLVAGGATQFQVTGIGGNFANSIINDSSPQFSDGSIYTPSQALTDKVGLAMFPPNGGTAALQIDFSAAVTNPVFHVANLDSMIYDFSPTAGLNGLTLLSGNGGADSDGLAVNGLIVEDANPLTIVGVSPAAPVPTEPTARSGYGSVQLLGTFTSLDIALRQNPGTGGGDGNAFTISTAMETTPEPASALGLLAVGTVVAGSALKRKQR